MFIREIMATDIQTVKRDTPIEVVEKIFTESQHGTIPVVDESGELVGVVTLSTVISLFMPHVPVFFQKLRDIDFENFSEFRCSARKTYKTVDDFMIRDVIAVDENDHVMRAALVSFKHDIRRLPVVRDGKVVGLVGRKEIWKAMSAIMAKDVCPSPTE